MSNIVAAIGKRNRLFSRRQAYLRKYAMPVGEDVLAFHDPAATVQSVDKGKQSARFIISTQGEDRDGDIVVSNGCVPHLATFERNPVVFWDHQNHPYPIALSEYPSGGHTIKVENGRITGEAFFHGKTKESSEICELVMEGILRCASVGFRPIKARKRNGGEGHVFEEWELTEWSIVALGANADAIRLRLDAGRIKSLGLRSTLEPFAARTKKNWSRGVDTVKTLAEVKKMFDPEDELEDEEKELETEEVDTEDVTDAAPDFEDEEDDEEDDDEFNVEKADEDTTAEAVETDDAETTPVEDAGADTEAMPGAVTLASLANHYAGAVEYCQTALKSNENPAVRALLEEEMAQAESRMARIQELAGSEYGDTDFEALKSKAAGDMGMEKAEGMNAETDSEGGFAIEDEDEPEEVQKRNERVKIVKRLNKAGRSCVKDAAEYLDDLAGQSDIPKRYSAGCKYHGKSLNEMLSGMEQTEEAVEDDPMVSKRLSKRMDRWLKSLGAG